jgi:hypothetical protein
MRAEQVLLLDEPATKGDVGARPAFKGGTVQMTNVVF